MRILIYGFKPYGPYRQNVSEEVVAALDRRARMFKRVFDVRFDRQMFLRAFSETKPDIIIGMGQHPRARKIRIERKAQNRMKLDSDNFKKIDVRGPDAIYATLLFPQTPGTTVTYDAGTYVCNYSLYMMGSYAHKSGTKFGFLHLPLTAGVSTAVTYLNRIRDNYPV